MSQEFSLKWVQFPADEKRPSVLHPAEAENENTNISLIGWEWSRDLDICLWLAEEERSMKTQTSTDCALDTTATQSSGSLLSAGMTNIHYSVAKWFPIVKLKTQLKSRDESEIILQIPIILPTP